jgi:DNA repair protein RadC
MLTQTTMFEIPERTRPAGIKSSRLNVVAVQLVKERKIDYDSERFTSPLQIVHAFRAMVGNADREYFVILILDGKNRITSIHQVSQGSLNQSIVHPREVFKAAILANGAAIILAHNHPTGDTIPSQEDIEVTKRLKEGGELLGIKVLDHVVIDTESEAYYSFSERGLL